MKTSSADMLVFYHFPDKAGLQETVTTLFVALVYILSTNELFISIAGFDFNPSKLFVILSLPVLLLIAREDVFQQEDFLFFMFIIFSLFKSFMFQDIKLATGLSNFIVPFLFYLTIRSNLNLIKLRLLVFMIALFAALHAGFGLLQFVTGDNGLLFVEVNNEFKLKYASSYSFNPFEVLLLLPHGLYGYSSVLAISLVFPLFLVAGSRRFFSLPIAIIVFGVISTTIFLCFSRFEILSLLLLLVLGIFVVKDGRRIMFLRLFPMIAILVASITFYLLSTDDSIGSVSARLITLDVFHVLIGDVFSLVLGVPNILGFLDKYNFHIPHNMYFYLWIAYGFFAACFFSAYLWFKAINYFRFYKLVSSSLKVGVVDFTVYIFVFLFLLFLLCLRAFDYYIVDGYENILLFFYCFIILDKVISSFQQFDDVAVNE